MAWFNELFRDKDAIALHDFKELQRKVSNLSSSLRDLSQSMNKIIDTKRDEDKRDEDPPNPVVREAFLGHLKSVGKLLVEAIHLEENIKRVEEDEFEEEFELHKHDVRLNDYMKGRNVKVKIGSGRECEVKISGLLPVQATIEFRERHHDFIVTNLGGIVGLYTEYPPEEGQWLGGTGERVPKLPFTLVFVVDKVKIWLNVR
tara:strand:+ start:3171 stop:3776 length:606 start_codon:yes stop_codon:yes gene_type:complete